MSADDFVKALNRIETATIEGARAGLLDHGERVMDKSLEECPIEDGNLRGTGKVYGVKRHNDVLILILGYGSAAVDYAVYVHERMNARHKAPTKAKYLEDPVVASAADMEKRLGAHIRKAINAVAR